jgi:hypothetical protein
MQFQLSIEMKQFRFNPADYGSTCHVVKKLHIGKTTILENGEVIVQYNSDSDLLSLFFRLALYTIPEEETITPVPPYGTQSNHHTAMANLVIAILTIIGIAFLIIKIICDLIP